MLQMTLPRPFSVCTYSLQHAEYLRFPYACDRNVPKRHLRNLVDGNVIFLPPLLIRPHSFSSPRCREARINIKTGFITSHYARLPRARGGKTGDFGSKSGIQITHRQTYNQFSETHRQSTYENVRLLVYLCVFSCSSLEPRSRPCVRMWPALREQQCVALP